ncbi:hypothetical protein R6Q57_014825 [Mikania cordata]
MADMEGVLRHQKEVEFHQEVYGGSQDGFNIVRDHVESLEDEDYNEEEDTFIWIFIAGLQEVKFIRRSGLYLMSPVMDLGQHIERSPRKYWTTRYRWDPSNDYVIREAFQNVLKKRYPDIMLEHRATSAKRARDAGYNFPND